MGEEGETQLEEVLGEERKSVMWCSEVPFEVTQTSGGMNQRDCQS